MIYKAELSPSRNKSNVLADFGCLGSIVLGYLPIFRGFDSTIINLLKLIMALFFLSGVMAKDFDLFKKMTFILSIMMIFSSFYYYRVWYLDVTLLFFLNRSTLCWLYALFGVYYSRYGSTAVAKGIVRTISVIVIITCITTMISLVIYPEASRALGNGVHFSEEETQYLYQKNTAFWGLIYGMTFIIPIWIDQFKKTKKMHYLVGTIIITICEFRAQITFAIIFTLIFWIFMFIKPMKVKTIFWIILFVMIIGIILQEHIGEILFNIYHFIKTTKLDVLKRRIYQLYITFSYGKFYGDAETRMDLYGMSLMTFLRHPLLGAQMTSVDIYQTIGMHSQICDTMAATGLFGISMCVVCFFYIVKDISRKIKNQITKRYYLLEVIVLIALMFVNPVWSAPESFGTVFFLPVLYDKINTTMK